MGSNQSISICEYMKQNTPKFYSMIKTFDTIQLDQVTQYMTIYAPDNNAFENLTIDILSQLKPESLRYIYLSHIHTGDRIVYQPVNDINTLQSGEMINKQTFDHVSIKQCYSKGNVSVMIIDKVLIPSKLFSDVYNALQVFFPTFYISYWEELYRFNNRFEQSKKTTLAIPIDINTTYKDIRSLLSAHIFTGDKYYTPREMGNIKSIYGTSTDTNEFEQLWIKEMLPIDISSQNIRIYPIRQFVKPKIKPSNVAIKQPMDLTNIKNLPPPLVLSERPQKKIPKPNIKYEMTVRTWLNTQGQYAFPKMYQLYKSSEFYDSDFRNEEETKQGKMIHLFMMTETVLRSLFKVNNTDKRLRNYLLDMFDTDNPYINLDESSTIPNILMKNHTVIHNTKDLNDQTHVTTLLGCDVSVDQIAQLVIDKKESKDGKTFTNVIYVSPIELSDGIIYMVDNTLVPEDKCFMHTLLDMIDYDGKHSIFKQWISKYIDSKELFAKMHDEKLTIFIPSDKAISNQRSMFGNVSIKTIVYNHIFKRKSKFISIQKISKGEKFKNMNECEVNLLQTFPTLLTNLIFFHMDVAKLYFVDNLIIPDVKCLNNPSFLSGFSSISLHEWLSYQDEYSLMNRIITLSGLYIFNVVSYVSNVYIGKVSKLTQD